MFAKTNRLSLSESYQRLKKKGKWLRSSYFDLLYSLDKNSLGPKIGLVVSNKISSLATKRHKIKRLLAEALRPELEKVPKGLNLVVFTKKEILDKNFWQIKKEVEKTVSLIKPI